MKSVRGTDFLVGSNNLQTVKDLVADVALGSSFPSTQLVKAALFDAEIKETYPEANITFTAHSLGAGLASILSVWFNRPATVFANAPFELSAVSPAITGMVSAALLLNGHVDTEFVKFVASASLLINNRQSLVSAHYVKGEVLDEWLGILPFVVGDNNRIDIADSEKVSPLTLHSIVLHASLIISDTLRRDTFALPSLIARIFDARLYATKLETNDPDFLTKLLNSQISKADGLTGPGKLTSFADDMATLGTDAAGLSAAAQNAIISQGIEWYFWQGTDYPGQPFFSENGTVLQYTTAQGAGFADAKNQAGYYVRDWLATYFDAAIRSRVPSIHNGRW